MLPRRLEQECLLFDPTLRKAGDRAGGAGLLTGASGCERGEARYRMCSVCQWCENDRATDPTAARRLREQSSTMVKSIVVTGANRGIGLGLVKELLKNDQIGKLFATTRNPSKSPELQSISDPRLVIVEMDADSNSSIGKAVEQIGKVVGSSGVDILINNAGVLYPVDINAPINRKEASKNFDVNCVATMAVTFAFKELLKAGAKKAGHSQVVNISSVLGSISLTWGAAGLNMYTKTLAMDWKADGIRVTAINPGWVKTDMGTEAGELTVEESTSNISRTIFKLGEQSNGLERTSIPFNPSCQPPSSTTMVSILVTGANRGIGLGLVRQLVQEPSVSIVIATARNIDSATDLKAIISPKLHLVQLEVVNDESIAKAAATVAGIVGENGLDFLVNNAGIFNKGKLSDDFSRAHVMEQLEVNTVAPLMITNKFRGLLKKAAVKHGKAQVANISSTLGSLEFAPQMDTPFPTGFYSISKAALNMLTRKLSLEWKDDKIRATSFCPGWVKTDMGTDAAALTLEESTVPLAKLILSLTEEQNGLYFRYNGETIPCAQQKEGSIKEPEYC
ncbi:hypothetical protein PRIPAC_97008 [Pristionchus pacificus]|uniref:Dehydrogenase n=1 Tax=Pristionchus pacificus TaxID=54126 RepID=A0A2A6BKC7_PRIPA|nr:hypothetical protein PRIPAC_97008 [Pristionchus pacificus]|eukprot:PDM66276.1 dehydrogenase [Pristionchus pacificus]